MDALPLWVGGEWVQTSQTREIKLPFDNSPVATVCEADRAILDRAISAAQQAAPVMAEWSTSERANLLLRTHALLVRDTEEFAQLVCQETGKPIREARFEVERCQQTLLASATAARNLSGEAIPVDAAPIGKGRLAMTIREPRGIIGAITPFNVPLNLAMHKIGPALAGGNTVVHKPAEPTPLSALRLARTFDEAGLPAGAYNVVPGDGETIGSHMVQDPRIAMITFTGSVAIGKAIRAAAGLKHVTLELGGNSPVLLDESCDLEQAVRRLVPGSYAHSGQLCISVQRIYAHTSLLQEFVDRFTAATEQWRGGHPCDEQSDYSSLISEQEAQRVEDWTQEAVNAGARLLTGGKRQRATLSPAILTDVPAHVRLSCQEAFGPVVLVYGFSRWEEAIAEANNTPFGLQAGVFARDLERAFQAARGIKAGGVIINDVPSFRSDPMPYGGMKESGIGREGPSHAIREMTESKLICWT